MPTGREKLICSGVLTQRTLVQVTVKTSVKDGEHIAVGIFNQGSLRFIPDGLGGVLTAQLITLGFTAVVKQGEL